MTERIRLELKIAGTPFIFLSAALSAFVILLFLYRTDLAAELCPVVFEVMFPFYAAVSVGEWGKTGSDGCFDVIAVHSRFIFRWAAVRYLTFFGTVSLFAVLSMTAAALTCPEASACLGASACPGAPVFSEMFLLYFPTAFFLSSLCALADICFRREHTSALICGVVWITALLTRSLLRIPGVEYLYLFIRFAGDTHQIWLLNKAVLTAAGLGMWGLIFCFVRFCHCRRLR